MEIMDETPDLTSPFVPWVPRTYEAIHAALGPHPDWQAQFNAAYKAAPAADQDEVLASWHGAALISGQPGRREALDRDTERALAGTLHTVSAEDLDDGEIG